MTMQATDYTCPAVLFLVFNRPDTTVKVFEAIRAARPSRLYVAADGPRQSRPAEAAVVEKVRQIATQVDWPCEVTTLFRENNLGCKKAVSSAIDWFFEHEQEGIILEDDCLPHADFFPYCAQLLERYRDDDRVGFIAGTAFCDLRASGLTWADEDYVYARYPSVWGWASWRRAWKDYDVSLSSWPQRRNDVLTLTHNRKLARIQEKLFDRVHAGEIDTWDYQVSYMLWSTSRLVVVPRLNLVENVGFGPDATHTTNADHPMAAKATMHRDGMSGVLRAPPGMLLNRAYQEHIERSATRSIVRKILDRIGL